MFQGIYTNLVIQKKMIYIRNFCKFASFHDRRYETEVTIKIS